MNLAKFPRRGYVTEPTPLEALPNFSKALGADINIYIKRDDLLPGTAGGNKTRKLDFSMADAINQGADTIITCGAVQSNHCRLTLAWAVKEGLDCHLVLEERVKDSYNPEASGNNFLFQLLGVKSVTVVPGGSNMLGEMEKLAEKLRAEGKKPYIVPGGASNKIGALGYVSCAEEVLRQLFDRGLAIDHMVVPSGSAGTHAGIIAGMVGNNAGIPVTGIGVAVPVWRLQSDGTKTTGTAYLQVNASLAAIYKAIFEEIYNGDEKFPINDVGCYSWRTGEHSQGTAVDINPNENMEATINADGSLTPTCGTHWTPYTDPFSIPEGGDVYNAFTKYGFAWGGNAWHSKRDYMHFSYFGK